MSTIDVLDAFSRLRRELGLIRAGELKCYEFGPIQMHILYRLSQSPATMGDLAAYTLSDKAAMTRAIASLEKSGLVRRKSLESDARVRLIELTAKGKTRATGAHEVRNTIAKKVNATLSAKERHELARLLTKVSTGLHRTTNPIGED